MSTEYHARLSPSASDRWLTCPGSIRLCAGQPDTSSTAAEEGTDAHELGALCLTLNMPAIDFLGKTLPNGNVVTEEMAEGVQIYLDHCTAQVGVHGIEEWVDLSFLTGEEGGGGTADHVATHPDILSVTDLKFGRSPVEIVGNTQLRCYAAGALNAAMKTGQKPGIIRMAIVQPRVSPEPLIEEISAEELTHWALNVLIPGAAATREPDAPLVPSNKGCRWCKAKGFCPALADLAAVTTGATDLAEFTDTQDLVPPPPAYLDARTLSSIMTKATLVRDWLDAVEAETLRRMIDGVEIPDWKLVQGRKGNRTWTDDEEAIAALLRGKYELAHETIYKLELLSPTSILKLPAVKENPGLISEFITQKEGQLCAAPAADKRVAVNPTVLLAAEFSDFQ